MTGQTPREAADLARAQDRSPDGTGDRVVGYGVMGVPFANGDYLALRDWPASSFGPGYRAVWHRDPDHRWTVYADAPPEVSCARFVSAALDRACTTPIELDWSTDRRLHVRVRDADLEWTVELAASPVPRMLTIVASVLPRWAWHSDAALRMLGGSSSLALRTGRLRLAGTMPNGQSYQLNPKAMWLVRASTATIAGRPLGAPARLDPQPRIGGLFLPQRGVFYAATTARFHAPDDALRVDTHESATSTTGEGERP